MRVIAFSRPFLSAGRQGRRWSAEPARFEAARRQTIRRRIGGLPLSPPQPPGRARHQRRAQRPQHEPKRRLGRDIGAGNSDQPANRDDEADQRCADQTGCARAPHRARATAIIALVGPGAPNSSATPMSKPEPGVIASLSVIQLGVSTPNGVPTYCGEGGTPLHTPEAAHSLWRYRKRASRAASSRPAKPPSAAWPKIGALSIPLRVQRARSRRLDVAAGRY